MVSAISVVSKFHAEVTLFKAIFGTFKKQWNWGLKRTAFEEAKPLLFKGRFYARKKGDLPASFEYLNTKMVTNQSRIQQGASLLTIHTCDPSIGTSTFLKREHQAKSLSIPIQST